MRGEAPFASHLLYTQVLDDRIPELRGMGMSRAFQWYRHADLMAVYTDKGISKGMEMGIEVAKNLGINIEYRNLTEGANYVKSI